ncbi:MAG: ABC transporter substrate-binding protein [Burkholderiales bacterium PBB1]|nr:MAG: ABC transporter substrate-binding protein [Burkholderiales bacterium PBB1]
MRLDTWRVAALAIALVAGAAQAVTLRVANQGDAQAMDPHALNEALQLSLLGNVYEPLVGRDEKLALTPALATRWSAMSPTVWRFELRRGVRFHDGTPLTAADVVFSFQRAAGEGSDMRSDTAAIKAVRAVAGKNGDDAIEIETNAPFPILPDVISNIYIMSRAWCEANQAMRPVDRRKGIENAATFKANGTGPFQLKARQPGTRTVLTRFAGYWAPLSTNVTEVVFTPIVNDATRVAALLSGEIDLMEPVPLQDIERVQANAALKVRQGPELRTIFLGMDQQRDELLDSNVKGRNPFKDRRVRQAIYQAIDIETIRTRVMRGAATPTALMLGPGVNGYPADLDRRLSYDPAAAKRLLAEAGYPSGFEVGMNCPNDRYVNDAKICQAVAANLARIGVRVQLQAEAKVTYFPKILRRQTSFYLLGWTPGTYDAHDVLSAVIATPNEQGQGQFNLGGYSNARVDALTAAVQSETDPARRNALIREALELHAKDIGHIPLHQQALAWGMKKNIELVQPPDNMMPFEWVVVK